MEIVGSIKSSRKPGAKLKADLRYLKDAGLELTFERVVQATLAIQNRAVKTIRAAAKGETVIRYKPFRLHKVSRPGDAPHTDSGTLAEHVQHNLYPTQLRGEVGTNVVYARALEFGTKIMRARPWLMPAVNWVREQIKKSGTDPKALTKKLKGKL